MAQDDLKKDTHDVAGLLLQVVRDADLLVGQHLRLARGEVRRNLHEITPTLATVGAGAGLIASGGVLGSLMLVHGLHRSTRLPLWGCYGLVGGLMTVVGAGLLTSGARRAASLRVVPHETMAVLREDVQWIRDQVGHPAS